MSFVPVDEAARSRARDDIGTNLVIEAGAGTGKTTLLVDRIAGIVRSGAARLDEIAAVTFTENAAASMKLRLRERLESERSRHAAGEPERERADAALAMLERAQISTIHALCAAILGERPLECAVVPGFRMADEAETDLLFAQAWEGWLAERTMEGDALLHDALKYRIPLESIRGFRERMSLRGLARTLLEQRDLAPLSAADPAQPERWREELLEQAARARELAAEADPADNLAQHLDLFVGHAEASRELAGEALVDHLLSLQKIRRNWGSRPRWPDKETLEQAREIAAWTHKAQSAWEDEHGVALHGRLVTALGQVVADYERLKRERGLLDFLDLLLLARDALRDRESVRRYFQRRFRLLLIDEFQDTDPLQVEIVELLAGDIPGHLTVVGDAKQSIYRFRRADVTQLRRTAEKAARTPGQAVLRLQQNFRSRPAILRFVNRVFSELIQASEEAGQPVYQPIDPPPGLPEEPSVVALRYSGDDLEGEELLRAEAKALATWLALAAHGSREVRDPRDGEVRPSRAGDVMVLVRRLSKLHFLEEALEAAGLRFTVEGGKSFFDRQEVHETLAALRALEDPTDRVSLVAALRSSFFGVDDRDIVSYSLSGGRLALEPIDAERPGAGSLAPAMELLEELHRLRLELSPPALVERLFEETRIAAALTGTRRGEAQIANLKKVLALARQASDLGVLTLRGFAELLADRVQNAREEPDLPSTPPGDPGTLRILSIHKAKGLEAPIVAFFDSADRNDRLPDVVPLWEEGRVAVGFLRSCQPPGWNVLKRREEQRLNAEARRLLYVACTRARDWLVVPQPPETARSGGLWRELQQRLPAETDADVIVIDADTLDGPEARDEQRNLQAIAGAEGPDPVAARWDAERAALIAAAAHRPLTPIGATRAAAREAPPPVATAPREGARDFGSLVHRVLEWIDLDASAEAVRSATRAIAPAWRIGPDEADEAARAVEKALSLPVLERARRSERVWRELRLWFPDGEELVEGIVDLVFEEGEGLVVVDYKTDRIADNQALAQAAHHAPQLQLYGRGLAQASGQRVRQRLVVFTGIGREVPV